MKKLSLKGSILKQGEVLNRSQLKMIMGGLGSTGPGGDNGNPCANGGCTNFGGQISHRDSNGNLASGNCSSLPASQQVGCHNFCNNQATGSFWC